MNDSDRKEFLELIGDMYGAYGQNLRANIAGGYWKGLKHMTLGEFRAVVEHACERLQGQDRGEHAPPTVPGVWDIHRRLKGEGARPVTSSSREPEFNGDDMAVVGNLALMKHIMRADKPADLDYAPDTRGNPVVVGPHAEAIAKILARWKNAWVVDAREAKEAGDRFEAGKQWLYCMAEADRQVREYLAQYVNRRTAA